MLRIFIFLSTAAFAGLAMGQPPKTLEYVFEGQEPFSHNTNASEDFVFSKGSYTSGSVTTLDGRVTKDTRTTVDCGNATGTYTSMTNSVSPGKDGDTQSFFFRQRFPAHRSATQTVNVQCVRNLCVEEFKGSCTRFVQSRSVISQATDITYKTLAFRAKRQIVNICSTDKPINVADDQYWTLLSVPGKDYGPISFEGSGLLADRVSGGTIDPSGLGGQFTVTAMLPFFRGTASASFTLNITNNSKPDVGRGIGVCNYSKVDLFATSVTKKGVWSGQGVERERYFDPSGLSPGEYTARLTVDNGVCSSFADKTVQVLEAPVPIALPDIISCNNDGPVPLFQRGNGAWFVFDEANQKFEPSPGLQNNPNLFIPSRFDEGDYRFLYRETIGQCATETQTLAKILPVTLFSLGPNVNACVNEKPFDFTAGIPGETLALNGKFSFSGDFVAGNSRLFLPAQAGVGTHYGYYTHTNTFGCTHTDTMAFLVGQSSVVVDDPGLIRSSTDTVLAGQAVDFFLEVDGGRFTWDMGDGGEALGRHASYVFNIPGVFDVTAVASSGEGCDVLVKAPAKVVVIEEPLSRGVDFCPEPDGARLPLVSVFPNPFSSSLFFEGLPFTGGFTLSLDPINGGDRVRYELASIGGQSEARTDGLGPGFYFATITGPNYVFQFKILKK